ncbi:MAG: tryptophan--tRNA ligase [Candidatus Anstonellales archaeon]
MKDNDNEKGLINPWEMDLIEKSIINYDRLFINFGLQEINEKIKKNVKELIEENKLKCINYFERNIIFAHRDFDKFLDNYKKGMNLAIISGIKPSNDFHLGSKLIADELVFFQKLLKLRVYYCIADLEAIADNNLPYELCLQNAISNLADLLALGIDEELTYFYLQSNEIKVLRKAFVCSTKVTNSMLKAIYGDREIDLYLSALVQMGDILSPYDDNHSMVLVPVGIDQEPHIRLARDLAEKFNLQLPSATYNILLRGLNGNYKMSKRDKESLITLNEDITSIKRKLKNVFTGGRNTAEEQRRLGGEIDKCVFYEICKAHFINDDKIIEIMRNDCINGKILCGECKNHYGKYIIEFFEKHQDIRKEKLEVAKNIVEDISKKNIRQI